VEHGVLSRLQNLSRILVNLTQGNIVPAVIFSSAFSCTASEYVTSTLIAQLLFVTDPLPMTEVLLLF